MVVAAGGWNGDGDVLDYFLVVVGKRIDCMLPRESIVLCYDWYPYCMI